VRGGVKVNVVPDLCEAHVDFRILPGHTPQDVVGALKDLVRRIGLEGVEIEVQEFVEPSVLTGLDWPVDLLDSLVRKFYGEKPLRIVMPGASDARFLRNWLGVPAVQFGPGVAEAAHAADEYVEVEDLIRSTQVYVEFAKSSWPDAREAEALAPLRTFEVPILPLRRRRENRYTPLDVPLSESIQDLAE